MQFKLEAVNNLEIFFTMEIQAFSSLDPLGASLPWQECF